MTSIRSLVARIPGIRPLWRTVYGAWRRAVDPPARRGYDDRPTPDTARWIRQLRRENRRTTRSAVDQASPVVVALTTFGPRLRHVHLVLESIAQGDVRPSRLVLYVEQGDLSRLTRGLRRLERRGVELALAPDGLRSYKKLIPYVRAWHEHPLPLVTADDDVLYPGDWLAGFLETSAAHPGEVLAWRARRIQLGTAGIEPYASWPPVAGRTAGWRNFGTGVSGQLLPATLLDAIRAAGDGFLELCPTADDVWIHAIALRSGHPVRQIAEVPRHFPFVPGTQHVGLYLDNTLENQRNDEQIRSTYQDADVERMRTDR